MSTELAVRAAKPPIRKAVTYTYAEIAAAFDVSESFIRKEVMGGRLPTQPHREGRYRVCSQADIDQWRVNLQEHDRDRRAQRVTRRDQQGRLPRPKPAKRHAYAVQADDDIKAALNIGSVPK